MYDRPVLDIDDALKLIDAVLAAALDAKTQPVAAAVVDDNGDWVAFARMDGAPAFSREYAQRKAYTASLMRLDLQEFGPARAKSGRPVADLGNPRLVGASFGGVVIKDPAGNIMGGLGVSGAAPEEDERIARAALAAAPVRAAAGAA